MGKRYRVGVGSDLVASDGTLLLADALAEVLEPVPGLAWELVGEPRGELRPEEVRDLDAVVTLWQRVTPATLAGAGRLATVARWGVGFDLIDVTACTERNVLVAITRDAVRRPVAEGIVALVLALAKRVVIADRHVRAGVWAEENTSPRFGLRGRVLGTIGVGNIGAELVDLFRPFGLHVLATDPYVSDEAAAALGVELVDLDALLAESDFVCVNCPLSTETRHLVGEPQLRRMRSSAFLVNTARGAIVDEAALVRALEEGWIAGAALDVFEEEPLPDESPLRKLDNVILAPHAIARTDELFALNGLHACGNVLTVLRGDVPPHVVNRDVLGRSGFQDKLAHLRAKWEQSDP